MKFKSGSETIKVRVGDVFTGVNCPEPEYNYFPELEWNHFEDTFEQLRRDHQLPCEQWAMFDVWNRQLEFRFGKIPEDGDTLDQGRLWAFDEFGPRMRRMSNSFREKGFVDNFPMGENFKVKIHSDGLIYMVNGNKRVAACRLYHGLDFEIEAEVVDRHEEWDQFRNDLFPQGKNELYHPVIHPDFKDWPITQPCEERWAMMAPHLPTSDRPVLDLGCHSGWFCRKFSDAGYSVIGVDNEQEPIKLATAQRLFHRKLSFGIEYHKADAVEFINTTDDQYSCVLCLSMIMHVFRIHGEEIGTEFLNTISKRTPLMFFDCGFGGYQKVLPFRKTNVQQFILSNTDFRESEVLGMGRRRNEARPLFMFKR